MTMRKELTIQEKTIRAITQLKLRENQFDESDFETINKALERAYPQEPVKISVQDHLGWFHLAKCPRCERHVTSSENFCIRCGQRLDWVSF